VRRTPPFRETNLQSQLGILCSNKLTQK